MSVEPNQATIQLTGLRERERERDASDFYLCTWQCVQNTNSLGNILQILDQQQLEQIFLLRVGKNKKNYFSAPTLQTWQLLSVTGIQWLE